MPTPIEEAQALIAKGSPGEAIEKLALFLNEDFFNAEALMILGAALTSVGKHGMGAVISSAAVDSRATQGQLFPEALTNLGWSYKAGLQPDVALKIWQDALMCEKIPASRAKIMANIGGLFVNAGCPEKAIPWCEAALNEDPHQWAAHTNAGMAYLEMGRWREGWIGFSYTYLNGDRYRPSYKDLPTWDGGEGQRVIVFGDQGVGDEIYFASCFKDMIARCERVYLDCHPRLTALFKRSFPLVEVYGTRKHISEKEWVAGCDADSVIGLADLMRFFRNDGEWDGLPYLNAPALPDYSAQFRDEPIERPLRVGISWAGGMSKTHEDLRSIPIDLFAPLIRARPDAQWFSLQYSPPDSPNKGKAAREVCEFEERTGLHVAHYPGWVECFDYDRTASFINSLDLVITVCTTVHHCAGALGVPVWTLVPSKPSWRYGLKGETLPWYGSAKLYRQEGNDWAGLIGRVAGDLEGYETGGV